MKQRDPISPASASAAAATHPYRRVWAYRVRPETLASFKVAYGPTGDWARLFARAPGFIRTELWRDAEDATRLLTTDTWRSREDYEAFLARWRHEYDVLDERMSALIDCETALVDHLPGRWLC